MFHRNLFLLLFSLSCKQRQPYMPPDAEELCRRLEQASAQICADDPEGCGEVACYLNTVPEEGEIPEPAVCPGLGAVIIANIQLSSEILPDECGSMWFAGHDCIGPDETEPWPLSVGCIDSTYDD